MERSIFGKKPPSSQMSRVDRFIPSRHNMTNLMRSRSCQNIAEPYTTPRTYSEYIQRKNYTKLFNKTFGLESGAKRRPPESAREPAWPCAPRKRRHLSSADSVLDLPIYSGFVFPEVLDWNKHNILVAALDKTYHLWSWDSQALVNIGYVPTEVLCCKFEPQGQMLALGTDSDKVEVHDSRECKCVSKYACRRGHARRSCAVSAVDWSPTGNSIAVGCTEGIIMCIDSRAEIFNWDLWCDGAAIQTLRISPDARFLAAKILFKNDIPIYTWPDLKICIALDLSWDVVAINWHPWRSALLGIGCDSPEHTAKVALWDAHGDRLRELSLGPTNFVAEPHCLDTLMFSQRTGEMIVSLWNTGLSSYLNPCSTLLVLSEPDTVVDHCEAFTMSRVRTIIGSPDGTKLAAATVEEDLIIWNFLPEDKNCKNKQKLKRFSSMPMYLDHAGLGYTIR